MKLEDLSPELQEKVRACKSKEELAKLAESVGVKLSDNELDAVAGGICKKDCPWHGAICRVDTQCLTKTSCPTKSGSPIPFECTELVPCPENFGPIPASQD